MNVEETKQAIAVMQAWVDGKTVEHRPRGGDVWAAATLAPNINMGWLFDKFEYRIKPEPRTLYTVISAAGTVLYSDFNRDSAAQILARYGSCTIMESKEVL